MKRHYYAIVTSRARGDLFDVVRFDSKAARDYEVKNDLYHAHGVWRIEPIKASDAGSYARLLYGIAPYERYFGTLTFCRPWYGCVYSGTSPELITH